MGNARFSDEFKRDAVRQITERGYPVAEVSQRLGVSQHSLYEWRKKFSKPAAGSGEHDQAAEIRRLKRELARVTEERDILKKRPRTSPRMQSEVRVRGRASPDLFDPRHVPLPLDPTEWVLCVAEGSAEQAGAGGRAASQAGQRCMGSQRQGLWLSQAPR